MDQFNWFFERDRFAVYKTFKHDSSVVYRMTTWTNMVAYSASWLFSTKVSVIFFKVQSNQNFSDAYMALESAGLTLDPNVKNGLSGNVMNMLGQKIQIWNTVLGDDIKTFCARNRDKIDVAVKEVGHLRIFYVVWEPEAGKRPRTDGFREFCADSYKAQLTHAEFEKSLRGPLKWIGAKLVFSDDKN